MKNILKISLFLFTICSCNSQNKQTSSYKIANNYYVIDSAFLGSKFKIIVLEKKINKTKDISQHNSLPIIILEKRNNLFFEFKSNKKIFFAYNDNCPADGYQSVVSKNSYFTIEQTYCLDFKYVYSYTTFFVNQSTSKILLHKFGEEYTDRSNPDKKKQSKVWTKKDFGDVEFENVNEDFLKGLRKNNPKN